MEETSLLSLPEGMLIEQIQITENGLIIAVAATSPTSSGFQATSIFADQEWD